MKKISTKITLSMLAVVFAILTFVGVMLIINMSVDYYRDFERAVSAAFDDASWQNAKEAEDYVLSVWDGVCADSEKEYYILQNGNIIKSSEKGGLLKKSDNLSAVLSGGEARYPDITSGTLDYAVGNGGVTVYILDKREALKLDIRDISVLFLQALFIGVVLAAVLSFIVSKRLTASLAKLKAGAKRMSKGEFERVTVKGKDEVYDLCNVFNEMGEQIKKDFDEFEMVEKSRREFVSNVSHELKTPLTVIKSYSQTLMQNEVDTDTSRQFLGVIDSEVDRMTGIVGQLLRASRLSEQVTVKNRLDLLKICTDIADTLNIEADKKNIRIEIEGGGEVVSDATKVSAIITNLLTNAIKYSEFGGVVRVTVTDASVAVEDNGIGIPKKDLPHVFERFYRTDKARGRETGGTGLGLAIALESAQAIGADIKAESVPQEFTRFTLEF